MAAPSEANVTGSTTLSSAASLTRMSSNVAAPSDDLLARGLRSTTTPTRVPAKLHLPLLYYLTILSALIVLLILDVDFKARSFSSSDSNSFRTATTGDLRDAPMVAVDLEQSVSETSLSSWSHFRSTCDNLTAFDSGGGFVVLALGSNCTLGQGTDRVTTPHIVVASTVRLDSIVWTCCKLLFPSQQPSICQDHIATDFLDRYMLPDIAVTISDLAVAGTDEERELQVFLDMVSRSYPLYKVVCVEGFIWTNETLGSFNTTIYGCASPNSFRSEFIGLSNPKVRDMLRQRMWLSRDQFEVLGVSFGIRQNSRCAFAVEESASGGVVAVGHVDTNFSCFGPLYSIMLGMDLLVLLLYLRAGYDAIKWVLGPQYKKIVAKQSSSRRLASRVMASRHASGTQSPVVPPPTHATETNVRKVSRTRSASSLQDVSKLTALSLNALLTDPRDNVLEGVVYCSLFNDWRLVVLIVASQLLSWLFVLPNIVIWSWSLVVSAKIRAGITSFRSIVLVMLCCDLCWAGVTKLNEELAYFVASRTFVSPLEIMAIGAGVAKWHFADIMKISDRKWAGERQRVFDYSSFTGYLLIGNVFDGTLDFRHDTPLSVLGTVYMPLFRVIAYTIVFTVMYLLLKGSVYSMYYRRRQQQLVDMYDPESTDLHGLEYGEYQRLPVELLLDCPIRARSIMRNNFSMEILIGDRRIIQATPACIYAFDLLFLDGESYLTKPLAERRSKLREMFELEAGSFELATSIDVEATDGIKDDADAMEVAVDTVRTFLEEAVRENCEGLMVKTLQKEATYEPANRSHKWLKLKKDYLDGIGDSTDLVPIGAFHGRGKRTGVYGAYLLACYDPDTEMYQPITKLGTGLSDDILKQFHEQLREKVMDKAPQDYATGDGIKPDVWFEPTCVWEILGADLSISPKYTAGMGLVAKDKGISLRFPRFIRIRDDKSTTQATTSAQIADLYRAQGLATVSGAGDDDDDDMLI